MVENQIIQLNFRISLEFVPLFPPPNKGAPFSHKINKNKTVPVSSDSTN